MFAQATPSTQVRRSQPVTVRGQIHLPGGGPLQMQIRMQLISEDPSRPPEYIYSDSQGRFILGALSPDFGYRVEIEADPGKSWGDTTENFIVLGPRFVLNIHLRPPRADPKHPDPSVSVAKLSQQDVPKSARKEYESAVERMERADYERARALFERAIELFPDYVDARNELAVILLRDGKPPEAEAQLRRALQVDGDAVRPLLNLGLALYRQERYKDAIEPLERATQLQPGNYQGNLLLGMVLVQAGNDKDAEAVLLRAYEQGGKRAARAQYYLSHIYARRKNYPKAAAALDTYLADSPDEPNAEDLRTTLAKLRTAKQP